MAVGIVSYRIVIVPIARRVQSSEVRAIVIVSGAAETESKSKQTCRNGISESESESEIEDGNW